MIPPRATEDGAARLNPRLGEFLRFAAVGVVGLFADMAALTFARRFLGLDLYSGRVFSYLVAATTTWALNRRFTFSRTDQAPPLAQWLRFLGANALGGAANYGVYAALVTFTALGSAWPNLAVAAGSVAGLTFNYTVSKRWVFKK